MGKQKHAQQQPLITPSASPPPSSQSFFPKPFRIPDQPSPTKRPRLSSTSRQNEPSSAKPNVAEFHKAREESAIRMLDVWASLAERHSRPLDKDDIIDIRTGEVVKDRGVLRGSEPWTLGVFADATVEDVEEDFEDNEQEDDADELDTLTRPETNDLEAEVDGGRVPPVTERDPRDAEDLKDFLEAEQRRREIYGSEPEDSDGSVYEDPFEENFTGASRTSESADFSDGNCLDDSQNERDLRLDLTSSEYEEPLYVGSSSDDELGSWGPDQFTSIYSTFEGETSDDEVEITMEKKSPPPTIQPRSLRSSAIRKPLAIQRQLQTPPLSHTSSSLPSSSTPDDYFNDLPPNSSSPNRSSSPFSLQYGSSPTKPTQSKNSLYGNDAGFKLPAVPHVKRNRAKMPIPRLDLIKMSKGRPSESEIPAPAPNLPTSLTLSSFGTPSSSSPQKDSKPLVPSQPPRIKSMPKTSVEVVIERRTPRPVATSRRPGQARENTPASSLRKKPSATESTGFAEDRETIVIDQDSSEDGVSISRSPSPVIHRNKVRRSSRYHSPASDCTPPLLDASIMPEHTHVQRNIKREQATMDGASTPGTKRKRIVSATQPGRGHVAASISLVQSSSKGPSVSGVRRRSVEGERIEFDSPRVSRRRGDRPISPERRSESSDVSDDTSDVELYNDYQRRFSRTPSHTVDYPPYPHIPSYSHSTPQLHSSNPHTYAPPVADPRAQLIISQAMQQLSALVGGPWTPQHSQTPRGSTPYPPSHQQHPMISDSTPMYSSPAYHPRPYLHAFKHESVQHLGAHNAYYSTPIIGSSSELRSGALVRRGRSRGRKVSFDLEENSLHVAERTLVGDGWHKEVVRSNEGHQRQLEESLPATTSVAKRKGKETMREERLDYVSDAKMEKSGRGQLSTRGQTPGPPDRLQGGLSSKLKPSARRKSR